MLLEWWVDCYYEKILAHQTCQGCNIHDIDLVVQWKLPGSISAFIQRAGRAARHVRIRISTALKGKVERTRYDAGLR